MINGEELWLMVIDKWLMVNKKWLMVINKWLMLHNKWLYNDVEKSWLVINGDK